MDILSYIFYHMYLLWERGEWVDDLFDGWGWGGTGQDWILVRNFLNISVYLQNNVLDFYI